MSSSHCEMALRVSGGENKSPIAFKEPNTAFKSDFFISPEFRALDASVSRALDVFPTTMLQMALKDRIREVMQANGWSQAELARQAQVSRSAVNQWLDGTVKSLDATVGFTLQKVSNFSAQWLLTGEGTKTQHRVLTSVGGKARPEIDLVLLKDSIQGVELYLKEERQQASPAEKARLVALAYEHSLSAGRVDAGAVRRILRLVS